MTSAARRKQLSYFQEQINKNYIAPIRNKNVYSALSHNDSADNIYAPNYSYGEHTIPDYSQDINIIVDGGGQEVGWFQL